MFVTKIMKGVQSLSEKARKAVNTRNTRRDMRNLVTKGFQLTAEQERETRNFWKPYSKKMDLSSHRFYTEKTGCFSPMYIPNDIYISEVDEYFNNRLEAQFIDNKCYYQWIFADINQPKTVACRIGGFWYSVNREIISIDAVRDIVNSHKELFAKVATLSCGGHGVVCMNESKGKMSDQLEKFIANEKGDIIVQEPIRQHKDLAALNESSVNTYRILSVLTEKGPKIYSGIVRMGVRGARVDNASSGGISCGISDEGKLKKYAYFAGGARSECHPTNGYSFEGISVPYYDKACELVKKAHPMVPHFKMIAWDITIGEDGDPILVEVNLSRGMVRLLQINNGPLFGEDTKAILDDVFGKTSRNN